jgi:protein TonB
VIPTNISYDHDGLGNSPIIPLDALSRQPEATVQFPPNYPFELRRNGIEGKVLVSFVVDARGYVHNAVAEEGPHPEFASAAAAAVSKWRFRPGAKDGVAVATRMQIPVWFNLDSKP